MQFQIEIDAKGVQDYLRDLPEKIFPRVEIELNGIIEQTTDYIHEIINSSRKRPDRGTHKLENSIDWGGDSQGFQYQAWIGDIERMNQEAKYWQLIDDGGTYTTKKDSKPIPLTYFDGSDGFIRFKAGSSHTITGINFTTLGKDYLMRNLNKAIEKALSELK